MKKILTKHNIYLRNYLLKKFSNYLIISESNILEIGIGKGRFGILFGDKFRNYYGVEPNKNLLYIAQENKKENMIYKEGRAESIPFKKKFDIIFYALSWHFINDFNKAIDEAGRVLKKNGMIVIVEPTEKTKYWKDSKLNKNSLKYNEIMFNEKMKKLRKGKNIIFTQKQFTIIENEFEPQSGLHCYILKKK